jgi:hypothetical protein
VKALPSIINTKPQEPLDVIISYNGSSKLIANLADLIENKNHYYNESKITIKDLSLARLIVKAVNIFKEVIIAAKQISYFKYYIRGLICDVKTQGDLMGVARRVSYLKSDLSLKIVISKGKSYYFRWIY